MEQPAAGGRSKQTARKMRIITTAVEGKSQQYPQEQHVSYNATLKYTNTRV